MAGYVSSPILKPVTIGDLQLKNRIVMAPMTRSRSNDAGIVPDYAVDYYAQRAGAGLIVTEAINIARGRRRTKSHDLPTAADQLSPFPRDGANVRI